MIRNESRLRQIDLRWEREAYYDLSFVEALGIYARLWQQALRLNPDPIAGLARGSGLRPRDRPGHQRTLPAVLSPPILRGSRADITRELREREIPFMPIGGQAVLLHGPPRLTD